MKIEYKRFDSTAINFNAEFSEYENSFYEILAQAYPNYYGEAYHSERIRKGKAVLYIALDLNKVIGASYVKKNNRRGGTAVVKKYRRKGIAEELVRISLNDFPKQYTILSTDLSHSHKMLSLVKKLGFLNATKVENIKNIIGNEFSLLTNFREIDGRLIFDRNSSRRNQTRKKLTLMYYQRNKSNARI